MYDSIKNFVLHGEKRPCQEVGGGFVKNTMMVVRRLQLNLYT